MSDSSNQFAVGMQGKMIVILRPRSATTGRTSLLSKEEAINLAAWIVALADPGQEQFNRLLEEIQK